MADQLPVPLSGGETAIVEARTTPQSVIPALIADAGEQALWRYVEIRRQHPQHEHAPRLCTGAQKK